MGCICARALVLYVQHEHVTSYMLGPVASILTQKFGWRFTTMLGGFLAGLGTFLSVWAQNIFIVYVTYGVIGG